MTGTGTSGRRGPAPRAGDPADAIVVGGGVAGCVVAARLVEAGRRVVLVEAGPGEPRPATVAGLDIVAAADEPARRWPDLVVHRRFGTPAHPYRQGRGLGGGSMINALLLSRGDRVDYRRWEEVHGCVGWGPDGMAPWLDRAQAAFGGVTVPAGPVTEAFEAAALLAGHTSGGRTTDPDRLGVLQAESAVDGDRRRSAVDAYLPALADGGPGPGGGPAGAGALTVLTDRPVERLLFDGDRATGVEDAEGAVLRAPVVVVCAGAIRTPLLLLASDLPPGVDRGRIGAGLCDHPSFAFTVAVPEPGRAGANRGIARVLRFTSEAPDAGDLQAFVVEGVGPPGAGGPGTGGGGPGLASVVVGLLRVVSRGRVGFAGRRLAGTGRPMVVTGALGHDEDRHRLRAGVRKVHELLRAGPMADLADGVYLDEAGTTADALATMDDTALDHLLADHPGPYAHPAGSCAMGPEGSPVAVVSSEEGQAGRVLGTRGLHLADASILPDLVQGGLMLPVAAIAERVAAELIGADP